jgi:transcriptional regulator with XRE-family HTH domain
MRGISQLTLAINAGLTHNFINDIENCKKGVSAKTLAKLSQALNVEPHQFYLPDGLPVSEIQLYVDDFNSNLQIMVKDLSEQYLAKNRKKSG